MSQLEAPRFKGEISAQEDLSTNAKGGSITAVLKKGLASVLGLVGPRGGQSQTLAAAAIEIDSAHRLLIMATKESVDTSIRVRRTGKHSVELSTAEADVDELSPIAASFVELKLELFRQRRLNLSAPLDADDFEALTERALASALARHRVD